ncbi:hypothetical protein HK097_002465, partial [Rhizophlyctis rosea]
MSRLQVNVNSPGLPPRPLSRPGAYTSSDTEYKSLSDNEEPGSPFDTPSGYGSDWVDERAGLGATGTSTKSFGPTIPPKWSPSAQHAETSRTPLTYSASSNSYSPRPAPQRTGSTSISSLTKTFREKAEIAAKSAAKNTADWHARASQPGGVLARAKEMGAEISVKAREAATEAATAAREAAAAAKTTNVNEVVGGYLKRKDSGSGTRRSYAEDEKPANPVFGSRLVEAVSRSQVEMTGRGGYRIDPSDVPAVVYRSIEFLDICGLEEVGIYRLSGSSKEVAGLKQLFNAGADLDLTTIQIDPHTVSSMFKSFLRELPESILTQQLNAQFSEISAALSASDDPSAATVDPNLLRRIGSVCLQLPRENYALLAFLSAHLYRVQERQALNKMNLGNLQVIFSPTLGMSSSLLAVFIMHHETVLPLPVPPQLKRTPPPPKPRPASVQSNDS